MKFKVFINKFATACDEIYEIVGDKPEYSKKDGAIMFEGAFPIFSKAFEIPDSEMEKNMDVITEKLRIHMPVLSRNNSFEGCLLALAFSILEGTKREKNNFGKSIMFRSLFLGGIRFTNDVGKLKK